MVLEPEKDKELVWFEKSRSSGNVCDKGDRPYENRGVKYTVGQDGISPDFIHTGIIRDKVGE